MIDCITFALVIALLIGAGIFKSRRIRTESSYLFAERKTKWAALTATLVMTEFNSATLISFASLGYAAGFWALTLPFIFLFGLLFYAMAVAKKWKAFDGLSVAGFFTSRYGRAIGGSASILLLIAMLGFSAAYIKSLTLLFLPLLPSASPWLLSLALCSLVLLMTLRGGLIAIIRTDALSLVFMLIFFPLVAYFMWQSPSLPPLAYPETFSAEKILPLRFVFSLTILTMFTYILAPWYGQKIFAAENGKAAYRSVVAAAFLIFLLYGSAIVATALFRYRGFECPSWEMALPHLIDRCLPSGVKGFAYALLFATSATTLTGVWSAMSAMWIGDFSKADPASSCKRSIRITLLFAMASLLMANTLVDKVFDKLILANIPVAALSFGLLAGFYWKRASRRGVMMSIAMGCLCGAGACLIFGEQGGYTWYWAVWGVPLTFLTGTLSSLLLPDKKPLTA
ncbi:MAG: sodium:solute symporter [Verrucomicrobia bacterium]|nr:sodium:solute symporter [Verrucomicrobiota bacterium]